MFEIALLAVLSAFYPVLLVIDLVAFQADRPARLLASFLAGGLLTTVIVGVAVVSALHHTSVVSHSNRSTTDPVTGIVFGTAALIACVLLARRVQLPGQARREARKQGAAQSRPDRPSWPERMLTHGVPLAFLAGVVLDILPGVFPLVALKDIAELGDDFAENLAIVLVFNLVLFTLIEIPLAGYVLAPERTTDLTRRLSAWLERNARTIAIVALGVGGVYLLVRGLLTV